LTSGTLSPLDELDKELGISFKQKLSNLHVINSKQIYPVILGKGIRGKKLNFRFEDRDDKDKILDMGYTLLDICRRIRGGILVFFPSYTVMEQFYNMWIKVNITF
jgi:Rad3-related DNA helicase